MMRRTTREPRSKLTRLLAVSALAVPLAVVGVPNASAGQFGPYNIDGTIPDAAVQNLPDAYGSAKELGPLNASSTKIGVIHNAANPMLGLTNPNAQVDLRQGWVDLQRVNGNDWLYFAWERDANTGSGFIAYEFMKNKAPAGCAYDTATDSQLTANCNPWRNRQAGDFMILWDQQGSSRDLYLRTWSGTGSNLNLGAPEKLEATKAEAAYGSNGFRGEAAVNLTAALGTGTECLTFANTIPSTVTGNSDTADYKDTILTTKSISTCTSTTVTTPSTAAGVPIGSDGLSIGTGVVGVKDSAVVSLVGGTATPTGSVAFWLCKVDAPALCDKDGTPVGSTDLTGSAYPVTVLSPTAYVTSAGRYCWRAAFSGDSANGIPGSSDWSASECFTVNPVTPTLSTQAGPDVFLGSPITDSAALSGTATQPANPVINLTGAAGPAAGGTITFKLYGPNDCTTLVRTSAGVPVSGNGTYNTPNPQFVPTKPGTYHWVAAYSGSPNTNGTTHNDDCSDPKESVVVTSVASSLTSAQSWVPNDSATVSAPAGGKMTGTVSFTLYPSSDCTGTPVFPTVERAVDGNSPQTVGTSNSIAVTASGTYSWKVSYTSTNSAQRDIPASCHETSALTIENGGTVSSP